MPIIIYNTVHTGADNQLGGLKPGLVKVAYHVFTEVWVAKLDKNPTIRQMPTAMAMYIIFFFKVVGIFNPKIVIFLFALLLSDLKSIFV